MTRMAKFFGFAVALTCAPAALAVSVPAMSAADPGAGDPGHVVALNDTFRRCDYSPSFGVAAGGPARAFAVIRHDSPAVLTAEVHLDTARPGTHYDVRLIQAPQVSSIACTSGDPGIAEAGLDTDGAGNGTVTFGDKVRPGTTGAWVFVSLRGEGSQIPAESYTSDYLLAI